VEVEKNSKIAMVLKSNLLLGISLFFCAHISVAQGTADGKVQKGAVYLNAPYVFKQISENRVNYFEKKGSISGFRIQVFFSSSRNEVQEKKSKFSHLFPEYKSYIIYQQPYYKLRVGNFEDRQKAQRFIYKLNEYFPNSFIIPDDISIQP
jgi:hypothetical protein